MNFMNEILDFVVANFIAIHKQSDIRIKYIECKSTDFRIDENWESSACRHFRNIPKECCNWRIPWVHYSIWYDWWTDRALQYIFIESIVETWSINWQNSLSTFRAIDDRWPNLNRCNGQNQRRRIVVRSIGELKK